MKDFMIFKVKEKKNENSPDYRITAKVNDKLTDIGAAWKKKSDKGTDYLSCKLSDVYQDKPGFSLVEDGMTNVPAPEDDGF